MKLLTQIILISGVFLFAACGWSDNQKEATRKAIGDRFTQGLEGNGQTVSPKVKEAWLDCVMEKVTDEWTFDEVTDNPNLMDGIQDECAKDVGLYDAIEVK